MWSGSEKVWSETEGCGQRVRACPCGGVAMCKGVWSGSPV